MRRHWLQWILAIIITISAAIFQRMTGPTYPLRGIMEADEKEYSYKLIRSHGGEGDQPVEMVFPDTSWDATVLYKRHGTKDDRTSILMKRYSDTLKAALPHQPPAGKLDYYILFQKGDRQISVPKEKTVVTRFKGAVPAWALIPHVLLMFTAMLLSTMSGLEALNSGTRIRKYTMLTSVCLFLGGMILGPVVQKFAFGAYWTGIPFGFDLTDNKTLFAMVGWLIALWLVYRGDAVKKRWWVVAAAIILILVYSIPHSTMGSELNYETMQVETG